MLQTEPFKRGDTFSLAGTWKPLGVPTDASALIIASQIRRASGTLIATLTPVLGDQQASPGKFTLVPQDPDTSGWPIGNAYCDIQIDDQGIDRSTETFVIPIIEDVTR